MSNRRFDSLKGVIGPGQVLIAGSFQALAGAGTIVASAVKGFGFGFAPVNGVMAVKAQPQNNPTPLSTPGIVRTGTAVYVVTFEDPYLDCDSVITSLQVPVGGVNLDAVPVSWSGLATASTGPSLTILLQNAAGSPTEGATTQRVNFWCVFRDSNVQFQKP